MVVRVRVKLTNRKTGKCTVVRVLANGGAESEVPVIVLNPEYAVELGLWPSNDYELVEVGLASGKGHGYVVPETVVMELIGDGETLSSVEATVVIDPNLEEPLITDAAIDELGIQVLSFKRGFWRHKRDPPDKVRV